MSDKPLFQHVDEQEAVYAPEQLPEQSTSVQAAEPGGRTAVNPTRRDDTPLVPPVAGVGSGTAGPIGTAPVIGAELGATVRGEDTANDNS